MLIWQLLLLQIVTFILIILFLKWLLHGQISRALRRLQQLNQENLEKERVLKEELERAKREAQRKVEEGRQEAEALKKEARQEAEKSREDIVDKARKEAKRLINEAVKDCQRKSIEFTVQMQEKSLYLAVDMIGYIFSQDSQEGLHSQLIDELIGEIKGLEQGKIKTEGDRIKIISAYPLAGSQKKKLNEIMHSNLGRDIELDEEIDRTIIAGLIMKSGGFVIDGSIRSKLKKILPIMKEEARK